ncbi:MAG: M20/M25/M40 family metallo-hydrolase, partial [Gemmatimonadota bacterium]|nr:M20/M25/M40 family metallo-hydrolase [Gemmatimonadota bacterium]
MQRQELSPGRANIWATRGHGAVTLSTHLDTVPPFIGPVRDAARISGRGACDAKGIAAAMMTAAQSLADEGETGVDLLFVVGEEKTSDGARAANELAPTSRFLINGEPTEGKLASGAKGSMAVTMRTNGRAAHSAYAELGTSALTPMLALLS